MTKHNSPDSTYQVLFIGGQARNGSTLAADLLAQPTWVINAGELGNVWKWGCVENRLCGCGVPFCECPFWHRVMVLATGRPPNEALGSEMAILEQRITTPTGLLQLWVPWLRTKAFRAVIGRCAEQRRSIYDAIAEVTSCQVIIDSSKSPEAARILREMRGIRAHMIHLVRDSRAVAFSHQRRKVYTDVHWTRREMERRSTPRSLLTWIVLNLAIELEGRRFQTFQTVAYESLAALPGSTLRGMAERIGEPALGRELAETQCEVTLPESHTAAGNPSRFGGRLTRIQVDQEWMTGMGRMRRYLSTLATAPLLLRYSYPLRPWVSLTRQQGS